MPTSRLINQELNKTKSQKCTARTSRRSCNTYSRLSKFGLGEETTKTHSASAILPGTPSSPQGLGGCEVRFGTISTGTDRTWPDPSRGSFHADWPFHPLLNPPIPSTLTIVETNRKESPRSSLAKSKEQLRWLVEAEGCLRSTRRGNAEGVARLPRHTWRKNGWDLSILRHISTSEVGLCGYPNRLTPPRNAVGCLSYHRVAPLQFGNFRYGGCWEREGQKEGVGKANSNRACAVQKSFWCNRLVVRSGKEDLQYYLAHFRAVVNSVVVVFGSMRQSGLRDPAYGSAQSYELVLLGLSVVGLTSKQEYIRLS